MKILGVIPARIGSKRLKEKNIKLLNGEPLISYTINSAKKSKKMNKLIVSTDSEKIANIAKKYEVDVPFIRPEQLAGDDVRNSDTLLHSLDYFESIGEYFDAVILLQPTSPFRSSTDIDNAIDIFLENECDTLASVKGPYKKRDINIKKIIDNKLVNYSDNNINEEYYIYNAAIYIVKVSYLKKYKKFVSTNEVAYVMNDISSVDIDTNLDFIVAQAFINKGLIHE
ncbi:MAG: acylneuraminate cytidylyltransferase family protein [Pseudomonadota bacterium]|nr:acylneuraminate cytidylyltransferase family protein [Pseudomonadota bacterium]